MNSDKALPEIEIDFKGEKKRLVFSLQAFCILEEVCGINALDGSVFENLNVRTMSALLWAGLSTHDKNITLSDVRDNLSMAELRAVCALIVESFKTASADQKKSDDSSVEAAPAATETPPSP